MNERPLAAPRIAAAGGARTLPSWLKARFPGGPGYQRIKTLLAENGLHTVCEEARCPNIGECWNAGDGAHGGTATFMILGDACTRGCRFCAVSTAAKPPAPDPEEPIKLAKAVSALGLDYAVITTVCRDDLPDQGAGHVAACLRELRSRCPGLLVEALIQDFRGDAEALGQVLGAGPHVLAHNLETVERLTPQVRDRRAGYRLSLSVLRQAKRLDPRVRTKSSIMLGLGETEAELETAFSDLREAGVDALTLGQYLRPTGAPRHLPVERFVPPEEFERLGARARAAGFDFVAAGPFVRSSYRAGELYMRSLVERSR